MNFLLYEMIGDFCRRKDKTIDEKISYLINKRYALSNSGEALTLETINSTLEELYKIKYAIIDGRE